MSSIHSKGIYMCSLVFATVIFLHELGAWVILLGMSRSMKPVPSLNLRVEASEPAQSLSSQLCLGQNREELC